MKKPTALMTAMVTIIGAITLGASTAFALQSYEPALTEEETQEAVETDTEATTETDTKGEVVSQDDIADSLNASQQLKQTFTLRRTINGEVVETESRTVTYDRNDPLRQTEARQSVLEEVRASFDSEVLTRSEAFEEAKLDFTIADTDRDGAMTAPEFGALVMNWRDNELRQTNADSEPLKQQQRYISFVNDLDPQAAQATLIARAEKKFAFMAGAASTLQRKDYIREYLVDFDAMDGDSDGVLKGDELMHFRAANRGEAVGEDTLDQQD